MAAVLAAGVVPGAVLPAQDPAPRVVKGGPALALIEARDMARQLSPELAAAREGVAAASARERQAGVYTNPTLSYQREQTAAGGATNSQNILSVDQPVELGGLRRTRVEVARLRREAAEARLEGAQAQLDFEVTRAYALAVAADRRGALAQQAATAFARARTVSETQLVQGDVSGYANRRIRLEAARYAGILSDALLARRTARLTLASLVGGSGDYSLGDQELLLEDSLAPLAVALTADSLRALAERHRAELRIATLDAEAAVANARLVARERVPVPVVSAGFKNERVIGGEPFNGFVAGVSLPVPLWDRRRGALEAAAADARRAVAEADVVRRRVAREVEEAVASWRAIDEQLSIIRPQLGAESEAALCAAQLAYSEGEISLVEWLDAVRAYQEAESTFAGLRAESLIRRAALERAVGAPLSRGSE